uniref:Uncharacterized protein n=1 Tax=Glossina pallidipes TaxID=7398 RepID=A0A1A9Z2A8_GLOPL
MSHYENLREINNILNSSIGVLKKEIDLEKSTLKYRELSKIPEEIVEEEEQEDHFQSLANELSVASKIK